MSLAEQIAFLTNPTPVFHDPEDDPDKDTTAKVVNFGDEEEEKEDGDGEEGRRNRKEEHGVSRSTLRARTAALLDEGDKRYAGKRISRKELLEDEESESDETDSEGSEDDIDDDEIARFKSEIEMIPTEHLNEGSSDGGSEDDEEISENEEEEERVLENDEGTKGKVEEEVRHFSEMHLDEDAQKGKAIKCQLGMWDSLLESRIKLQKVMLVANQLPQHDTWSKFCEKGGHHFNVSVNESQKKVESLLETLVHLQDLLFARNPETRFILNAENGADIGKPADSKCSDEEIPSDTEDEVEGVTDRQRDKDEEQPKVNKRKLKANEYPEFLRKRHCNFERYRNATIEKWNERTKLTTGKLKKSFAGFEQSALKQIEQILSDKERLIKRTQMKRNAYVVLGKTSKEEDEEKGTGEEYDEEIFDDNDFYHQLLRDLIERKTANVDDPIALGRQWLHIQKLRSKMKRKVDTRASKGRKVRYDVHSKLVNFMAPMDTSIITDDAKNELYNSLFGKSVQ